MYYFVELTPTHSTPVIPGSHTSFLLFFFFHRHKEMINIQMVKVVHLSLSVAKTRLSNWEFFSRKSQLLYIFLTTICSPLCIIFFLFVCPTQRKQMFHSKTSTVSLNKELKLKSSEDIHCRLKRLKLPLLHINAFNFTREKKKKKN